jgi:hypothetical protein
MKTASGFGQATRPVKSISVKRAAKKKRNERSKSHLKTSQNFVLTFQSTLLSPEEYERKFVEERDKKLGEVLDKKGVKGIKVKSLLCRNL